MSAASVSVRSRLVFRGRVQGVFFRATSRELATRFAVTGFVRNLPDGAVELEAQGARDQVRGLIDEIRAQYAANISDCDESAAELVEGETTFEIRY